MMDLRKQAEEWVDCNIVLEDLITRAIANTAEYIQNPPEDSDWFVHIYDIVADADIYSLKRIARDFEIPYEGFNYFKIDYDICLMEEQITEVLSERVGDRLDGFFCFNFQGYSYCLFYVVQAPPPRVKGGEISGGSH